MFDDQIPSLHKHNIFMPRIWLFTDKRTEHRLERDILALPPLSGIVFRHYHLPQAERQRLFTQLKNAYGHRALQCVWSGDASIATRLGADGVYGSPSALAKGRAIGPKLTRLAAVHNLTEIRQANSLRADLAFCSPVFATRTHEDARALGAVRFAMLSRHAHMPVCALGGVTHDNFAQIEHFCHGWGAIDGLSKAREQQ